MLFLIYFRVPTSTYAWLDFDDKITRGVFRWGDGTALKVLPGDFRLSRDHIEGVCGAFQYNPLFLAWDCQNWQDHHDTICERTLCKVYIL